MAFGAKGKGKPRRTNQQSALFKRKKFCRFTAEHVEQIDYKDIDTLRDFIRPVSRGRRRTISVSSTPRSSAPASSLCCPTPITRGRVNHAGHSSRKNQSPR